MLTPGGYIEACMDMSVSCTPYDTGMNRHCTNKEVGGGVFSSTNDCKNTPNPHIHTCTHFLTLSLQSHSHTQSHSVGILSGPDS